MSKVVYRKSGRRAGVPLLAASALLLLGLAIANLVWPKRDMIELENRKAAQFPAFSIEALLDGRWQSGFARWMQDQFLLRDAWINTQRAADEIGHPLVGAKQNAVFVEFGNLTVFCQRKQTVYRFKLRHDGFRRLGGVFAVKIYYVFRVETVVRNVHAAVSGYPRGADRAARQPRGGEQNAKHQHSEFFHHKSIITPAAKQRNQKPVPPLPPRQKRHKQSGAPFGTPLCGIFL